MFRNESGGGLLRTLLAGVLALALAAAAPCLASADEPAAQAIGSLTITQHHNEGATYDAYQVFAGDVAPDGSATHLTWASDQTKDAALAYFDAQGYEAWLTERHPGEGQHDFAQNAAEYASHRMAGAEAKDEESVDPSAASFGLGLAKALAGSGVAPSGVATAGEPFEGAQGLWLFVTTDTTTDAPSEAGTLPLWLPLGAEKTQVDEKSAVPAVSIEVCEDSTGTWGKTADAHRAQEVGLRVTGTLPTNFASFEHYHYRMDVHLPKGMTLSVPKDVGLAKALVIRVGDHEVVPDGEGCIASLEDGSLAIDFPDLKAACWQDYGIGTDTKVTCQFKAQLNDAACIGMPGNAVEASLTYTDDPVSQLDGQTGIDTVTVFSHQVELLKVADQTDNPLEGAEFTVQVAPQNADEPSRGRYVGADGSLSDAPQALRTDGQGRLRIAGLDEGVYLISETTAPAGYAPLPSEVGLTLVSTLSDMDQALTELTASSSLEAARVTKVDPDTATVSLTVRDAPLSTSSQSGGAERLPQTGVGPIAGALIALGLAIAGISLMRGRA